MDASEKNYFKFTLKFFLALVLCLLVRLIPFRAPNVEPILATTMPMSRAYGALVGFSFALLSILLYDILTHTLGVQTFFTAGAYGILGLWSASYFSAKGGSASGGNNNKWGYVRFAIIGTLFFDAVTGLLIGPLFFHQSFLSTLIGQIPFTALHLLGNTIFAFILSPAIYDFLIKKKPARNAFSIADAGGKREYVIPINLLHPKII